MKNQPNKATVKDGLPTAEQFLRTKGFYETKGVVNIHDQWYDIAVMLQEYSDQQNAELREQNTDLINEIEEGAVEAAALEERVKELESDLDHHKRVIFSLQTDIENKKWFDVYEKDLIFLREILERFEKSDRDVTQREYVEQMLKDWIAELEAK